MTKLKLDEIKDLGKDVVEAWKLEGKDLGGIAEILFYPINSVVNSKAVKPTEEEIKEAVQSLIDIPRVAPLIVIFVSSPIPGSSLFYLSTIKVIEKITGNRIKMIPRRFRKIIEDRLKVISS